MVEVRKKIRGYPHYEISTLGNVYHLSRRVSVGNCFGWDKIHKRTTSELKLNPHFSQGYYQTHLFDKEGNRKLYMVHLLLAKTFLGKRPKHLIDKHNHIIVFKDGNKKNVTLENLKWREESKKLNK